MKNINLVCILILCGLCGCVEGSKKNETEATTDKSTYENIHEEDSTNSSKGNYDVKILNWELIDGNKEDIMKNCLTKEEETIVRDVERKYNRRQFENAEYATEYKTASLEDLQKYISIALKVLNEVLKRHGYKTPDESAFYKKIENIYGSEYYDFYKSSDFLSSCADKELVKEDYTQLERDEHFSTKYRMAIFSRKTMSDILCFEKEITSKDTFGIEYTRYDENSDILVDIKKLQKDIYANLYVFNDNKAAKIWLINNHLDFFNEINCYEDRDVNKKKLKNYLSVVPNDYENYDVIQNRSMAGYLWHGRDIFDLVFEKTDSTIVAYEADKHNKLDIKAFDLLFMYLDKFHLDEHRRKNTKFIKKICLFAKLEVELNKKHADKEKHGYFNFVCQSRASSLLDDKLLELAKKENYFDIESFDDVLQVIKWDRGNHYDPNETYLGGCIPFDYTTLLSE